MAKICKKEDCSYNVFSNGYCKKHQYLSEKYKAKTKTIKARIPIKRTPIKKVFIKTKIVSVNKKSTSSKNVIPDLIKQCDYLFSRLLRQSNANKDGEVECFTCSAKKNWKEMEAGHYVGRSNMLLRFHPFNVRVQCNTCNSLYRGNLKVFESRLKKENPIELLRITSGVHAVHKINRGDLIDLTKSLIAKLEKNNYEFNLGKNG